MEDHHNLSRRETQIMDLIFAEGELTVNAIRERLHHLIDETDTKGTP